MGGGDKQRAAYESGLRLALPRPKSGGMDVMPMFDGHVALFGDLPLALNHSTL